MSEIETLLALPFCDVAHQHPAAVQFFAQINLPRPKDEESIDDYFAGLDEFQLADCGMDASALRESFTMYVSRMEQLARRENAQISELRILGGKAKDGTPEQLDITIRAGEMICIVGPTGSGKSRLLEDIEYLAQGDTPSCRRILVNGGTPTERQRFAIEEKITAQLSQGMVFVMDLSVRDFLALHAESRMIPTEEASKLTQLALTCANSLAGEPFSPETSLTALSGGQSRALMIADLAFISMSPVVLIDEIENAGVDRKQALELLLGHDKIVFVVTHDPLIALMGNKRLVIGEGAVQAIIEPSAQERDNLERLSALDKELTMLRQRVRKGAHIDEALSFSGGYM